MCGRECTCLYFRLEIETHTKPKTNTQIPKAQARRLLWVACVWVAANSHDYPDVRYCDDEARRFCGWKLLGSCEIEMRL
jgi:hypothetical protein